MSTPVAGVVLFVALLTAMPTWCCLAGGWYMVREAADLRDQARERFLDHHGRDCTEVEMEWHDLELGVGVGKVTGQCLGLEVVEHMTVTAQ